MPQAHTAALADNGIDSLRSRLAAAPGSVLETLAEETGHDLHTVAACLPEGMCAFAPGSAAEAIMEDIADWESITLLMHTPDLILECKGPLPKGQFGRGYFNLGGGSPIGGHIRLDRCTAVGFVQRPSMGSGDSYAVIFFNGDGAAMFKIFVGRDRQRQLLADQVTRFLTLRDRLCRLST